MSQWAIKRQTVRGVGKSEIYTETPGGSVTVRQESGKLKTAPLIAVSIVAGIKACSTEPMPKRRVGLLL